MSNLREQHAELTTSINQLRSASILQKAELLQECVDQTVYLLALVIDKVEALEHGKG